MTDAIRPEMFRALFETAPDAMVVVDRDGRIVLTNPQADTLFGFAPAALLDQPIERLMPADLHAKHAQYRDRYMSTPRVRPMGAGQELVGQRSDGTQFPVEIALSPIETPDGRFFVASIRDISDTQRARQALIRARYDTVVAQAGQLALESTIEATLDRVPSLIATALSVDAVLVVFGRTRSEMQVRAAMGITADAIDAVLDALAAVDDDATAADRLPAQSFALADDSRYAVAVSARLLDVERAMGSIVALSRAPRRFDREALHFMQSVANLLAAAQQRHLTQEQLAHAQRLDAVGQLTGGVAHDFNKLLKVISGNLQLLEAELAEREDLAAVIGSALRAVGRGAELTRKLLAFARRQRLTPRAVAPASLLGELGPMLRRTLGEQVELEILCDDTAPVFADPAQLDAALINLSLNARDAMPRGGRLRIAARAATIEAGTGSDDLRPGEYVVFEVADTGLGMTPDVLARAFEPFFTTKEPGKGSGLGLSMVYGFVKQSGGHLRTHSRLGFGTRIELFLPRAQPAAATDAAIAPSASRGNEVVLVVEDEPDVRGIAVAFMRSLGYTVHAAANAAEALDAMHAHPEIALLFSDVVLGAGATGAELAAQARRLRPRLAVLLTSGYERTGSESTVQPGAEFELLRKPYRREELAAAARRALDGR